MLIADDRGQDPVPCIAPLGLPPVQRAPRAAMSRAFAQRPRCAPALEFALFCPSKEAKAEAFCSTC